MRVLVAGSRTWRHPLAVHRELEDRFARLDHTEPFVVVTGGTRDEDGAPRAEGADLFAMEWVEKWRALGLGGHIASEEFPIGPGGPLARDRAMVASRPDLVLAFIRRCERPGPCRDRRERAYPGGHGTHGATYTALLALEAGIELHVWRQS